MDKKIVTLIGQKQAKIGYKFTFLKPANKECEKCKLYTSCIENLKEGQTYEIVEIRNKIHECPVHQDGVQIVEVKEKEKIAFIESKNAFEGAIITFRPPNCKEFTCKSYEKCNTNLESEKKYKILEVLEAKSCKMGKKLKSAKLKYFGKTI
ncbi:MAG: UPF0179 family protein [Candidatus Helarchaeota archaeon]|nr:UPF0179 family protein [Candidatus Helarchaeota archaeon]